MKVTLFQDHLRIGGTEHQTRLLAREFRLRGLDVSLLTVLPDGHGVDSLREAGVRVRALQPRNYRFCHYAPGLRARIEEENPDILLCMGRVANSLAAGKPELMRTLPVIGTLRTGKPVRRRHLADLRSMPAVAVNSLWWRNRLCEAGAAPERIAVIPNGSRLILDPDARDRMREAIRLREGVPEDTIVFLNVARFQRGKRQRELISTLAGHPPSMDWRLWLVGDGPTRRACEMLAAALGVADRVRFFGQVAHPQNHYAGADIALSASHEDALPNFLVEAQCAGLPVVAVDFRGVREAFLDGQSGFLVPTDHNRSALAEPILRLAGDGKLRRRFGNRARSWAVEQFSPDRQTDRFIELFERTLRGEPAS